MADWLTPEEWRAVALSLRVSFWATLLSLPFGLMVAYALARREFWGKQLLNGIVHLPLILPPVVTGYLLLMTFGRRGAVGQYLDQWFGIVLAFRWTGAALAAAVMALPLMVRAMRLSLEAVDRKLEGAARTLGAGPWRTFFAVTLPLSMPGVLAGMVLGFARSIGEFGATITFVSNIPGETRTLPLAIYSALQVPGGESDVARLALVSVVLSVAALVASEWLARRSGAGARAGGFGHVL